MLNPGVLSIPIFGSGCMQGGQDRELDMVDSILGLRGNHSSASMA
jgi:hypothetical protein